LTTLAHDVTKWLAAEWDKLYGSAVFSGIVGNPDHMLRGGYHVSIEDQPSPDNYSVVRPDDKAPPGTWPRNIAAAIDMNLALTDMKVCHGRLRAVWQDRGADPRARYINAWNGWDGQDSAGRYDMVTGTVSSASDDHKWHIHLEIRRRWVTSRTAAEAILSILRGQSKADWIASQQEDDMTLDDVVRDGITVRTMLGALYGRTMQLRQNEVLRLLAKVDVLQGVVDGLAARDPVALTDVQVQTLADRVAAALVARPDNPLGEADKPVIVAAVREVFADAGTAP
jgi:hypothetical protein